MNNLLEKIFGSGIKKYIIIPIVAMIIGCVIYLSVKEVRKPSLEQASSIALSQEKLKDFMLDNDIESISVAADANYSLVAEKWIRGAASYEFEKFLFKVDMADYKSNINDCDDFARAFTVFSKFYFRKSLKDKSNLNPCAVGEFYYNKAGMGPHAINFVVALDENKKPKLLFFEPQTREFISLTKEEKKSCFFFGL